MSRPDAFSQYFMANHGLPMKDAFPAKVVSRQFDYRGFRDIFIGNQYLSYASDQFRFMRGAPTLPGVPKYGGNSDRVLKAEKSCGCQDKTEAKKPEKIKPGD